MNGHELSDLARLRFGVQQFASAGPARSVAVSPLVRSPVAAEMCASAHASTLRPAASVLKVPLVCEVVARLTADPQLGDVSIPVSSLRMSRFPSVLQVFDPAHRLSLLELSGLALVSSDNAAAEFLMEFVSLEAVRSRAEHMGAPDTVVGNGFDDEMLSTAPRANMMSARGVAEVLRTLFFDEQYTPVRKLLFNCLFNSRIPALLPASTLVAHKTGSLERVVNDVGVVYLPTTPVDSPVPGFILVVLCDDEPDPVAASSQISTFAASVFNLFVEAQAS